jgi:hypothetical protein
MHFRTPILGWPGTFLAEQEHACERRNTEFLHRLAQKQTSAHVNDSTIAGLHQKRISAGHARAIEQRIEIHFARIARGPFEPKFAKARELLAAW